MNNNKDKLNSCDFCGTKESTKTKLIKGKNASICNDCLYISFDILNKEESLNKNTSINKDNLISVTPQSIMEKLNEHVIKQEHAKKTIATSIYNHHKRILLNDTGIRKSDIILAGPSGCGKTTIVSIVANMLNIPFVSVDATKLTQTGYVGADVEGILTQLLIQSNGDINKAQHGIVLIDEFDKLLSSKGNSLDIGGSSVQRELLKVIEGGDFYINKSLNKKIDQEDLVKFNTSNNLFICAGAFEGIYEIIKKRLNISNTIGFNGNVNSDENDYNLIEKADDIDFIQYGFMKEIIGRIPVKTYVSKLEKDDIVNIIKNSKESPISDYQKLLAYDNIDLVITDEAISIIAEKAIEKNIGARGIRSIFEKNLLNVMFEAPLLHKNDGISQVIIDADYINGMSPIPRYKKKPPKATKPIKSETL